MNRRMLPRAVIVLFMVFSILSISSEIARADTYDVYDGSGNYQRVTKIDGSIYEYKDENPYGTFYGRMILAYSSTEYAGTPGYKTWNWDLYSTEGQVVLKNFGGEYTV